MPKKIVRKASRNSASASDDTRTIVTILLLLFVYPVGLILMWFWSRWKVWVKLLVTVFTLLPYILLLFMMIGAIGIGLLAVTNSDRLIKTAECATECEGSKNSTCVSRCMNKTSDETIPSSYPEGAETIFVDACSRQGAQKSECVCMFKHYQAHMSYDEFQKMDQEIAQGGSYPQIIYDAANACKGK